MDLEALRTRIAEILAQLAEDGITVLSNEELESLQTELTDSFRAVRAIGGTEAVVEANRCLEGVQAIRNERATRTETAAREQEEFDRLEAEIAEPEVVEVPAAEAEDPDPEDPEPEVIEDPVVPAIMVDAPAPAEVVVDPPVTAPEPVLVPAGVVVAPSPAGPAASPPASRGAPIAAVAARQARPPAGGPAVPKERPITAKFELAEDGRVRPKNRGEVVAAFERVHDRWARSTGISMNVPVLHTEWEYPEERSFMDIGSAPDAVTRRMDEALAPSLTAAGGICAPFPIDYSLLNISEDVRPVAAALPSFQTPRGGIQFMPSYVLSDVLRTPAVQAGNALAQYTNANDVAGNVSKPCQTFSCKTVTSAQVYAITRCVTFGNWNQRFYPELIDNIMSQVMAAQARMAEELLLSAICAGSTKIDFNGVSFAGATASLLAAIGRAVQRLKHSNRAPGATIRVAFPDWVKDLVREDVSLRLAHEVAQFGTADAWWDANVRMRGASPWYFIDGQNDIQELAAPLTDGPLPAFPHTVVFYVYFEGAWTFLDGGTMDLGIVRDSVLNPANNFQMFAETWEGLVNRGLPSLCVTATVCPNGASAGTYTPENCAS